MADDKEKLEALAKQFEGLKAQYVEDQTQLNRAIAERQALVEAELSEFPPAVRNMNHWRAKYLGKQLTQFKDKDLGIEIEADNEKKAALLAGLPEGHTYQVYAAKKNDHEAATGVSHMVVDETGKIVRTRFRHMDLDAQPSEMIATLLENGEQSMEVMALGEPDRSKRTRLLAKNDGTIEVVKDEHILENNFPANQAFDFSKIKTLQSAINKEKEAGNLLLAQINDVKAHIALETDASKSDESNPDASKPAWMSMLLAVGAALLSVVGAKSALGAETGRGIGLALLSFAGAGALGASAAGYDIIGNIASLFKGKQPESDTPNTERPIEPVVDKVQNVAQVEPEKNHNKSLPNLVASTAHSK